MIKLPNNSKRGFTLVELMIVITVIAILATIAVVSFTRVQKQARDTKRKAEIKSLQTALQAYFTEKQHYPNTAPVTPGTAQVASVALTGLAPDYIPSIPTGPLGAASTVVPPNTDYIFVTDSTGFTYGLCVALEAPTTALSMWKVSTANAGGGETPDASCTAL